MDDDVVKFDEVTVVAETHAALLLKRDVDDEGEWFPKSRIDWVEPDDGKMKGAAITVYVERWLAQTKGWA